MSNNRLVARMRSGFSNYKRDMRLIEAKYRRKPMFAPMTFDGFAKATWDTLTDEEKSKFLEKETDELLHKMAEKIRLDLSSNEK